VFQIPTGIKVEESAKTAMPIKSSEEKTFYIEERGINMRKPYSVGYFSSYDRGLECLLDMWPKIKEQVPEATLDIYYGWDTYDKMHAKNPQKMKWRWQMIRKMNQDGVKEHGRVNHVELAKAMKEIKVWAYPTEFTEIHCITALKAQEAGCIPVTTNVAALQETALGAKVAYTDIYTNEKAQNMFIRLVVDALNDKVPPATKVPNRYWPDVAKVWDKTLS
jgi:glycosyltransferase involved in cell wall biosynthesis